MVVGSLVCSETRDGFDHGCAGGSLIKTKEGKGLPEPLRSPGIMNAACRSCDTSKVGAFQTEEIAPRIPAPL